ncbi:MAG: DUF72 domain-containing protein [Verrucomicrobiota bacterium]
MIWIGTSGFQYPEWKGKFYPEKISAAKMLPFYATKFSTTEINYTFRRIPSEKTLLNWDAQTPVDFRFTLKAPQKITHFQKLVGSEDTLHYFWAIARTLGEKLGPVLFQLPPFLKKDLSLLEGFLAIVPQGMKASSRSLSRKTEIAFLVKIISTDFPTSVSTQVFCSSTPYRRGLGRCGSGSLP